MLHNNFLFSFISASSNCITFVTYFFVLITSKQSAVGLIQSVCNKVAFGDVLRRRVQRIPRGCALFLPENSLLSGGATQKLLFASSWRPPTWPWALSTFHLFGLHHSSSFLSSCSGPPVSWITDSPCAVPVLPLINLVKSC